MIKRAADIIAEGDLGKVVDFAIDLNRQKADIEKELEEAKAHLREEAKKKKRAEVELEGLTGTVTVTFSGLVLKTKKGADLKDLEVNLKPEVFATLFWRTIEISPAHDADDFLALQEKLSPADKAVVRNFIGAFETTGKVYVPR